MGLLSIEHSKLIYVGDLVAYAIGVSLMSAWMAFEAPASRQLALWLTMLLGLLAWSPVEYIVHRFVLHGLEPFRSWHAVHHQRPGALVGAPTLLTLPAFFALVFAPLWWLADAWLACAFTAGLISGYLVYALVHHGAHHGRPTLPGLKQRQRMHALHHSDQAGRGRYGVTSDWWDWLCRT
ncbi:MAG: sterol desaturase family protein [Burkholderiales bacterium]|nr:sterol desaturase family protein [Burkholderiales bacterium]MBH2016777.1 sterol desaturase family protein [Burkholderiales bacterium]